MHEVFFLVGRLLGDILHEIQDGGEVIRRKDKEPLPIFGGNLEVDTLRESLLTAGDTSQFFGDKFVEKTNLQVHGMQSCTVRVADATKSIRSGVGCCRS